MAQTISGGCSCKGVRYEADAEPVLMLNCHCRDCQQAGGGPYAPVMVVPKASVKLSGEVRYYRIVGNTGNAVERGFCPNCGCQVVVKLERLPDVIGFQAGSLDDPSRYKPTLDIFTDRAQSWDNLLPDTKKVAQGLSG